MPSSNSYVLEGLAVVEQEMSDHFKFAPDILSRLGEELIPNPEQGIIELVRNSYDADAISCKIELKDTSKKGGSIKIIDTGVGLTKDSIVNGWLVIGRSSKVKKEPTAKFQRIPVGDKGLGRLAALRLGSEVVLTTRPEISPNKADKEYKLIINWSDFEKADVVENVLLNITDNTTNKKPGTEVEIKNLKITFGRREIQRLAKDLILLSDPFKTQTTFHPELITPEFKDLEKKVHSAYFDEAEYHLKAKLNEDGSVEASVLDFNNKILFEGKLKDLSKQAYEAPPAQFDLWVYLLKKDTFSTRTSTINQVREWLSVVGGVHLYHRGLRVKPYGDAGHDWLEMNLARVKSPEERPGTNTSIGRILVDDENDILIQKTDRVGFIENEAFTELKRFAKDALDWMARMRLKEAERKREKTKQTSSRSVQEAKSQFEKIVDKKVPTRSKTEVKKAATKFEAALKTESRILREDLQLYRSLATAGTTSAVFAHESGKSVTRIEKFAEIISDKGKKLFGDTYNTTIGRIMEMLLSTARSLQSFVKLPMHLLQRGSRRYGAVDVNQVILDIVSLFEPFTSDAKIQIIPETVDSKVYIRGTVSILEAIITNFLTNTINAFNTEGARTDNRKVIIRTEIAGDWLLIRVSDNGPGIEDIGLDEIWLPGRTTTAGGTGFGLTIVRDSVVDLAGKITAIANGELGGAEFVVSLPLAKV